MAQSSQQPLALGIDIGGTGIKGGVVDTATGELTTERLKLATPAGGEPDAIVKTVLELIEQLGGLEPARPWASASRRS